MAGLGYILGDACRPIPIAQEIRILPGGGYALYCKSCKQFVFRLQRDCLSSRNGMSHMFLPCACASVGYWRSGRARGNRGWEQDRLSEVAKLAACGLSAACNWLVQAQHFHRALDQDPRQATLRVWAFSATRTTGCMLAELAFGPR